MALAGVPYEKILPPRLHKQFAASVKLTFTQDGEKDVPVVRGSSFNIVVTNTEKIRIRKESIRQTDLGNFITIRSKDEACAEVANLRLKTIASLPHLAIFSDEAHHTYGLSLDSGLKKVRKTVDYLADKTSLVCVVNTTGTPYFRRQPLKDVVIWYGLSEGIRDGILKDLANNIQAYDFDGNAKAYLSHVIGDFFKDYGNITLPNGARAKLAIYFPQINDLKAMRFVIDDAMIKAGYSPSQCLVNTSDESLTKQDDIDAFNRLNDPAALHRVILLVNKGTEGWNCPSLFACALARNLRTSNNFVLQAATRCLRQVPGNTKKARVYLSTDNFNILDRQLQETYGETIAELNHTGQETCHSRIFLRKIDLPPLVITQVIRTVVNKGGVMRSLKLDYPKDNSKDTLKMATYTPAEQQSTTSVLLQTGETICINVSPDLIDIYSAAIELASKYRLNFWIIYDELRRLYGTRDIPMFHLESLANQIEVQTCFYEVKEEKVDVALALVKLDGFLKEVDPSGTDIYTAEIIYPKDREHLLLSWEAMQLQNKHDFAFHYSPYNFDSNPEKSFFEQILNYLNVKPVDVEDIYFTGGLTDINKTDFFVEYKDDKGKRRRYTPDFVIRRKDGRSLIVEVKAERERFDSIDGESGRKTMAIRKWENLNPDLLRYQMIFTSADTVTGDQISNTRKFIEG